MGRAACVPRRCTRRCGHRDWLSQTARAKKNIQTNQCIAHIGPWFWHVCAARARHVAAHVAHAPAACPARRCTDTGSAPRVCAPAAVLRSASGPRACLAAPDFPRARGAENGAHDAPRMRRRGPKKSAVQRAARRARRREKRGAARVENTKIKTSYVRWARSARKKVNESARASCALTRFSCTLRD